MKLKRSNKPTHKIAFFLIFIATAIAGFGYFGGDTVKSIFTGQPVAASAEAVFHVPKSTSAPVNVETPTSPWIKLREGKPTQSAFSGSATALAHFRAGDLVPTTLTSADVNADGYPDLISGFSANGGGVITIHRGAAQAFAPTDPDVLAGLRKTEFPASFEKEARAFDVPASPDFIFTGRFLSGTDLDIAVATRGSSVVYIYSISQSGNIGEPVTVDLGGPLAAAAVDTLDPTKGFTGLAAATDSSLVVFDGSHQITETKARVTALDRHIDSLVLISPDGLTPAKDLFLLGNGTISRMSAIGKSSADSTNIDIPFNAIDFAAGEFIRDRRAKAELAVLSDTGSIYYLANGSLDRRPFTEAEMRESFAKNGRGRAVVVNSTDTTNALANQWTIAEQQDLGLVNLVRQNGQPLLRRAYITGNETEDVLVTDPSTNSLKVLFKEPLYGASRLAFTGDTQVESLSFGSNLAAALPVRLDVMGQQGIAVLENGKLEATPIVFVPAATFTVSKTADTADGVCNADCSLREAVVAANAASGADLITFAVSGTHTLTIPGPNESGAATGDLDITQSTTITGNGSANTILAGGTSAATGLDKVLSINPTFVSPFATSITGVDVKFGKNPSAYAGDGFGGGFDWEGSGTGTLTVTNTIVESNLTTDGDGGGIVATNSSAGSGSFTMSGSTVQNNTPARSAVGNSPVGGGIFVGTTTPFFITNSTITGNTVAGGGGQGQGGGIFAFGPGGGGGNSFITNSTISSNIAPSDGGGVNTTQRTDINPATSFTGNSSGRFGGAIFINQNTATSTISKAVFTTNSATTTGSGIYLGTTTTANVLNVTYSRFAGNTGAGLKGLATAGGTANATPNWWGCNTGPSASPCDTAGTAGGGTVNFTPWLQLRLTAASSPIVVGQTSALTASFLLDSAGGAVSASNLDVLIGRTVAWGATLGSISGQQATIQANGTATATYTGTAVGAGTATATVDSGPATANITVNKPNTTTAVVSNANPSVFGQSVTFTATVSVTAPGTGTPTGTVTFKDGASNIGTCAAQTLSSSVATCSISTLTLGSHSITATYNGDANFAASPASPVVTQVVNQSATTTTLASGTNPSVANQSVTFTATIAPSGGGAGTPTGTVAFQDSLTNIPTCAAQTVTASIATCTISTLSIGTHSISAVYSGDTNFTTSTSSTLSQVVNKASTTVALVSGTNPTVFGQSTTLTATISVTSPGTGTPTGTITFLDSAVNIGTCAAQTVAANVATCTISTLGVATHPLTAVYNGDANFNASPPSNTVSQVVNKASTSVVLTGAPNPSVFGQTVTFSATISVTSPGNGSPTGTVSFFDNAVSIGSCSAQAVSASAATCVLSGLSVGTHPITAVYNGDTNFNASAASNAVSQVVNKASTTVALVSGTNPSVFGQSVTLTATVSVTSPGSGSPTGTITFKDNAVNIGTCAAQTVTASIGTCSISTLAVGSHPITAVYNGDGNFNASAASNAVSQVVNAASTTVALVSGTNPSVFGQSVTLTATISVTSPGTGSPTGTVTFKDNAVNIGSCATQTVSSSIATCSISTLAVGSHPITAAYNGDTNFNSSTSNTVTQVVNAASTTVALVSGTNPSVSGQSVTFTATISITSPGTGSPTGTVTFKDNAVNIGSCATQTVTSSIATCSISTLAAGSHPITAAYNGDSNFNSSTSNTVTQVVNLASTTTTLISGANPSVFGQSVTFTATIGVTSPGSGSPTGTVTFKDGVVNIGTCAAQTVTASAATCVVSNLSVSAHSVTAVYNGDTNFATSTSNTVSQVINKAATTTALVADINPSNVGQSVTFTATISVTSPGSGSPTGTVTFKDNAVNIGTCSAQAVTASAATCSISTLTSGTHPITATYNGDGNFNTSSSNTVSQVVNAAPPDLTITKTNNGPWIQGGTGAFTLTPNNIGGSPSTGTITITDPMPSGLTIQNITTGAAWNCAASTSTNVSCTGTTAIAAGGSGTVITVNVNVAANAAASVTNTATIGGGGESNTGNDAGSTTVTINLGDTTLPTAVATLTNVNSPGGTLYTFTVTYADNAAVNVSTLDNSDIVVTGPNAFSTPATFVSVDTNTNGTPRVATYSFVPPGGTWDVTDNGTYTVTMQANQVADTSGNFVNGGSLGTFTAVPLVLVVDRTDDTVVSTCTAAANDCTLRGAIAAANAAPTADTITFDPAVFATPQTITLGGSELVISNAGGLTITGPGADKLTVTGNAASRIFSNATSAVTTISGMRLTGGTGTGAAGTGRGGAVYNNGGTLSLANMVITANSSANGGGASTATNGTTNITNCWFNANTTPGSGGAIQNFLGSTTNVTGSSFTANTSASASTGGGAIQANGTTNIANSTFGGNTANGASGGGIYYNGAAMTITNSTFSGNSSLANGGGIHLGTATTAAVIRNTIIAGNTGVAGSVDITGTAASAGNNIIGAVGTSGGWVGSDQQNVNPLLAPLGFYGGNGLTFALTSASPAVNAGQPCVTTATCSANNPLSALTSDERGAARIGIVDIGAFELNNSANGGTYVAQLPPALQGTAYTFLLVPVNNGATQAVTAGALPANVTLTSAAAATISGTPSVSGAYTFSITATVGANTNVTDYSLIVFAPVGSPVSVSGRVMTPSGSPAGNATVVLTGPGNVVRTGKTSPLGYYQIDNVPAGATYSVSQGSKKFQFNPVQVFVGYNLTNFDLTFTPNP